MKVALAPIAKKIPPARSPLVTCVTGPSGGIRSCARQLPTKPARIELLKVAGRSDDLRAGAARYAGHKFLLEPRSEEHTSELQSLMRISYAVFCLKKKTKHHIINTIL